MFWIGLNELDESSGWTWSDGSASAYFNWAEGQPGSDEHDCIIVRRSTKFGWHDRKCWNNFEGSICKKPGIIDLFLGQ
ncbi:hypothetical protein CAPTEDRAFT_145354 [Capitella teleta]|uniref:C-type lectin domain-containing protein n=1 Tax=Capitella teleta TaxID=283909 RepID=R7UT03_CAPTE|nr:hypothetical protein CAPTEDRAFT_145354 [Capitella teleta]|eukprot:ELU09619.1 hypothetical protein CAPTEDRAFT_145354 [Capitella teleta]